MALNAGNAPFTAPDMPRTRLSRHNQPARVRPKGRARSVHGPRSGHSTTSPNRRPRNRAKAGRQPTKLRLPAIPSTWRSPITPCQGATPKHTRIGDGPLTRCDSPEGGRWDGRQTHPRETPRYQTACPPVGLPVRRGHLFSVQFRPPGPPPADRCALGPAPAARPARSAVSAIGTAGQRVAEGGPP